MLGLSTIVMLLLVFACAASSCYTCFRHFDEKLRRRMTTPCHRRSNLWKDTALAASSRVLNVTHLVIGVLMYL